MFDIGIKIAILKFMKNISRFTLLFCALAQTAFATPSADIEQQINTLISKMTLQEKLGQLQMLPGNNGKATPEQLELARKGLLGAALNVRGAKNTNELQLAAQESRLKIPLLIAGDIMHGYRTIFPIPLGLAATFDPELVEQAAAISAREARAAGVNWTLAPMADIARDARWGPTGDTFGEDPYTAAVMTRAMIRGFQGDDYSAPGKIAACAKYLAASGAVEGGKEGYQAESSLRNLEQLYFPPLKAAVGAGVAGFMTADAALNGLPCAANSWLLRSVAKKGWKFDGIVLSGQESLPFMLESRLAKNQAEAATLALNAGVDMENQSRFYGKFLPTALDSGLVSEADINEAVKRVLRVKFRAGLMKNPLSDQKAEAATVPLDAGKRELAYKTALESIVLLKNNNKTLPIKKEIKRILVIGGLAEDKAAQLGAWPADSRANDVITVVSSIKAIAEKRGIEVAYVPGTGTLPSDNDDIEKTISAAHETELIIAVVGEHIYDPVSRDVFGDLQPTGMQTIMLNGLPAQVRPVVLIVMSARPLFVMSANSAQASISAWFPGTMGGAAIADILFGNSQPSGKLPVSWPIAPGLVPSYYNQGTPAIFPKYPFGHGLTYADFGLSDLRLGKKKIGPKDTITVAAKLSNKSDVRAEEVLQLYIQAASSSATRPVRELKAFRRVAVNPGKAVKVQFTIGPKELGFYNAENKFVVEPGDFKVWIGTSSAGGLEGSFSVTH